MELILIFKVLIIIVALLAFYAVLRNLDIIKIILIYVKNIIFK